MTGVSYAEIQIYQKQIDVQLRFNLLELKFATQLDKNADLLITDEEIQTGFPQFAPLLFEQFQIKSAGESGQGILRQLIFQPERGELECRTSYTFSRPLDDVWMGVTLHNLTNSGHWNVAQIYYDHQQEQRFFNLENPESRIELRRSLKSYCKLGFRFLGLAVWRIVTGYDCLAFLAGLLLTGKSWRTFLFPPGLFLFGQLLTFIWGVSGRPVPPVQFLNSAVALSAIYIFAENLLVKDTSHRGLIAAFFGLIYGLSFATLVKDAGLPQKGLFTALVSYNSGILLVVACSSFTLYGLTSYLDRYKWRRPVTSLVSLCFISIGLFRFIQRL